jgi:hypothetical protein
MTADQIALGQLLYLEGQYWYVERINDNGWAMLRAIDGSRDWFLLPLDEVCRRAR